MNTIFKIIPEHLYGANDVFVIKRAQNLELLLVSVQNFLVVVVDHFNGEDLALVVLQEALVDGGMLPFAKFLSQNVLGVK